MLTTKSKWNLKVDRLKIGKSTQLSAGTQSGSLRGICEAGTHHLSDKRARERASASDSPGDSVERRCKPKSLVFAVRFCTLSWRRLQDALERLSRASCSRGYPPCRDCTCQAKTPPAHAQPAFLSAGVVLRRVHRAFRRARCRARRRGRTAQTSCQTCRPTATCRAPAPTRGTPTPRLEGYGTTR